MVPPIVDQKLGHLADPNVQKKRTFPFSKREEKARFIKALFLKTLDFKNSRSPKDRILPQRFDLNRFNQLLAEQRKPLVQYFLRKGVPFEEAEELAQDTLTKATRGEAKFQGTSERSFYAWLYQIGNNTFKNYLRKRAPEKSHSMNTSSLDREGPSLENVVEDPGKNPLESLIDDEMRYKLKKAVRDLPDRMRQCLILRLYKNRSYEEIAILMRINVNTVKSNISQATIRLKKQLRREFDMDEDA